MIIKRYVSTDSGLSVWMCVCFTLEMCSTLEVTTDIHSVRNNSLPYDVMNWSKGQKPPVKLTLAYSHTRSLTHDTSKTAFCSSTKYRCCFCCTISMNSTFFAALFWQNYINLFIAGKKNVINALLNKSHNAPLANLITKTDWLVELTSIF